MTSNPEGSGQKEFTLSQEELAGFGEKVNAFSQTLPEQEQLLLQWLLARAQGTASEGEVSGYAFDPGPLVVNPPPGAFKDVSVGVSVGIKTAHL